MPCHASSAYKSFQTDVNASLELSRKPRRYRLKFDPDEKRFSANGKLGQLNRKGCISIVSDWRHFMPLYWRVHGASLVYTSIYSGGNKNVQARDGKLLSEFAIQTSRSSTGDLLVRRALRAWGRISQWKLLRHSTLTANGTFVICRTPETLYLCTIWYGKSISSDVLLMTGKVRFCPFASNWGT